MTSKKHNGNGAGTGVLAIVMKVIGVAITGAIALVGGVSAYYSIISKIDKLEISLSQHAKTMESIKALADEAVNGSDLLAFCLKAQIVNRGWVCPLANVEVGKTPRRALKQAVTQ